MSSTSHGSNGLTPTFRRASAGRAWTRLPALAASRAFDSPSSVRKLQFLEQRLRRPRERARCLLQLRQRGQPLLIRLPLRHIPQPGGHQDLEQVQGLIDRFAFK